MEYELCALFKGLLPSSPGANEKYRAGGPSRDSFVYRPGPGGANTGGGATAVPVGGLVAGADDGRGGDTSKQVRAVAELFFSVI